MRRALSASLAGAISASVLALPTSALAATVTARNLDSSCPPGAVPDAGFRDTSGTTFAAEIDCIVGYGVARGVSADTFDPHATVTRAQMASFLANVLTATGRVRPGAAPDAFGDDDGNSHERNIDWLAAEGVLGGFPDGTYRPGAPVTRAQMATFLNNLLREITGTRLSSATDFFGDDDGNPHEASIDGLASRGIVTGVAADRYAPHEFVTRQQMAAFLAREVDHLVDEDHLAVPFGPQELAVTPTDAIHVDPSDNTSARTADRGGRDYTVDVPVGIERIDIVLLPASAVSRASDGTPLFASNAPIAANTGTSIEQVDGATIDLAGGATDVVRLSNVAVRDRQVTFRVDSVVINAVVPVVWTDTIDPTADRLDLESGASAATPKPARETVAVGGAVSWGPPEPARGTNLGIGTIRQLDLAAGWYTLDTGGSTAADHLVRFVATDTFTYTASAEPKVGSPGPITHGQFQTWLSAGDLVDPSAYEPGRTTHVLAGDVPATPASVTATVQQDGKVRISFVKPTNPVADDRASSFRLERAVVTNGAVGTFAEVLSRAADLVPEFLDAPAVGGTYHYRVLARSVTGTSPGSPAVQAAVVAPPPATTGSRVKLDNGTLNAGVANGILDHGDELEFTFDRAVTLAGGWELLLVDRDGTQVRLNNTVAAITLTGTASNIVTVKVASNGPAPVTGTPGTTAGMQIGSGEFLQVVSATGVANATGVWNLAKSGVSDATWNNSRVVVGRALAGFAEPSILSLTAATRLLEAGRDEVQSISVTNADQGTWKVALGTAVGAPVTGDLALDTTAAQLQTVLEGLTGVGTGNVLVTGGPITSAPFVVTFRSGLSATDVPQLTVDTGALSAPSAAPVTGGVGATTVTGVSVNGTIVAGDRVVVHTVTGHVVGFATAGANGRTTVSLSAASVGQQFHVVVERASGHRSRTGVATAA